METKPAEMSAFPSSLLRQVESEEPSTSPAHQHHLVITSRASAIANLFQS